VTAKTLLVFRIAAQWARREMFRMEEDNADAATP